jgi:predicted  nucleic acid-binding Zn-ribbon protein
MKNKNINSKIDSLSYRIKSIKSKAENAKYLKESGIFQTLESDLEAAIILQKDVQTLKDLLKTKTKEMEEGVKKLKKGSKDARKILKKVKKSVKPIKEKKSQKVKSPAILKIHGSKKKIVKSKEKPVKQNN